MELRSVTDYEVFLSLLIPYYREGEDAETPREELEAFARYLYGLLEQGTISGGILYGAKPVGFALWALDTDELPFSNKPGWGTILEIGILPDFRGKGYGGQLVSLAESCLGDGPKYICAYGPAENFWKKCGYRESGETAQNGLKIFVKG